LLQQNGLRIVNTGIKNKLMKTTMFYSWSWHSSPDDTVRHAII
jgi:hypothetical protein